MKSLDVLTELEETIVARLADANPSSSYTARLAASGMSRVAQKVGEEGVEVAIAAASGAGDEALLSESADLLYHLTVLLVMRGLSLTDVARVLASRQA
ncbi:MAG: phosphoribosyl-ATP diphosphatase [Pseudomonadota bacterium]